MEDLLNVENCFLRIPICHTLGRNNTRTQGSKPRTVNIICRTPVAEQRVTVRFNHRYLPNPVDGEQRRIDDNLELFLSGDIGSDGEAGTTKKKPRRVKRSRPNPKCFRRRHPSI
jgi:hypothetical protein